MVQIIDRDTPFGQVAQNFGKSLGETFGEEVGKQRKAAAFQGIMNQMEGEKPLSLGQMYSQLMRTGAFELDEIQKLQPTLVDIAQRQARRGGDQPPAMGSAGVASTAPEVTPPGSRQADAIEAEEPDRFPTSLVDPKYQDALTREPVVVNEASIQSRMSQLEQQFPGRFLTEASLRSAAEGQLQAEQQSLANERQIAETQQNRTDQLRQRYDAATQRKLQAAGVQDAWSKVPAQAQDRIFSDAVTGVRDDNLSLDQAADKAATKALEKAKTLNDFYKRGGPGSITKPSDQLTKDLTQYRKTFDELGMLDEYKSELEAKGYGGHMAAAMAHPVSDGIAKAISASQEAAKKKGRWWSKLPDAPFNPLGLLLPGSQRIMKEIQKDLPKAQEQTQQAIDRIAASITPEDSFDAIALALDDAGLDARMLYDHFQRLEAEGQFQPSEFQARELATPKAPQPTIQDLATSLLALTGAGEKGRYTLWEAIRRRWLGKR